MQKYKRKQAHIKLLFVTSANILRRLLNGLQRPHLLHSDLYGIFFRGLESTPDLLPACRDSRCIFMIGLKEMVGSILVADFFLIVSLTYSFDEIYCQVAVNQGQPPLSYSLHGMNLLNTPCILEAKPFSTQPWDDVWPAKYIHYNLWERTSEVF